MKKNDFKKFLMEIRDKRDETLKEMASNLEITSQFLSAMEKGKKHIGSGIVDKIIKRYKLDEDQIIKLSDAVISTNEKVEFETRKLSPTAVRFMTILLKKYENLSDEEIEKAIKALEG